MSASVVTAQNLAGSSDAAGMPNILVVEDDRDLREAIADTLELAGFNVDVAPSAEQAQCVLHDRPVAMVISDVNMPGMDGHALLEAVKRDKPCLPFMLITAYGSIEKSVQAMQAGAVDYLVKPFEPGVLIDLVRRYAGGVVTDDEEPIAAAPRSREILRMARRVAQTDSTVLLGGESGTGKEVIAQFIHCQSQRSDGPFVAINCAAIPESMLEATLFGHEKGAFTGAHQTAPGKFEQANGGTLLLDEVSEMDLGLQAKLLRVLQERELERVGGRKTIELDVRVIATTNRNLRDYTERGQFREDLFYRLSVFPLTMPPLRDRRADILPLARHLCAMHTKKMSRNNVQITSAAEIKLESYPWPGNIRELDNVIQRALVLQPGPSIDGADLLFDSVCGESGFAADCPADASDSAGSPLAPTNDELDSTGPKDALERDFLERDLREREFEIIRETLASTRGLKKEAAEKLGISPRTLRYKLAKMRELGYSLD